MREGEPTRSTGSVQAAHRSHQQRCAGRYAEVTRGGAVEAILNDKTEVTTGVRHLEQKVLGRTRAGLGCMGMSFAYGPRDDEGSARTLHHALDRGVTFLDTADIYGAGHNEELIGRTLGGRREEFVLATKFGVRSASGQARSDLPDTWIDTSPEYVRQAADASLRRLGFDTIDLYYAHRRNPDVPIEDTIGAMAELVAAGKVRHLGLSEVSAATLRAAYAVHPMPLCRWSTRCSPGNRPRACWPPAGSSGWRWWPTRRSGAGCSPGPS